MFFKRISLQSLIRVEGDAIVWQRSSDAGCNLPFPASQKSLGHLSLSVHTDFLSGVIWIVHGNTKKYKTWSQNQSQHSWSECYKSAVIKVVFKLTWTQFDHIQVAFQGLGNPTCCLWWTWLCWDTSTVQESRELQQKVFQTAVRCIPSAACPSHT